MIHPGPWQNYKNRPDNKKLTTEELTYKYKQELLVHENFNYQQVQIQHQDNQGKRAPASSTSLLDYPGFVGGPYTKFKANTGIQIGGNVQSFPNGILNQSQINTKLPKQPQVLMCCTDFITKDQSIPFQN